MYDARQFTMAETAASCAVTPTMTCRNIRTGEAAAVAAVQARDYRS